MSHSQRFLSHFPIAILFTLLFAQCFFAAITTSASQYRNLIYTFTIYEDYYGYLGKNFTSLYDGEMNVTLKGDKATGMLRFKPAHFVEPLSFKGKASDQGLVGKYLHNVWLVLIICAGTLVTATGANNEGQFELALVLEHNSYSYVGGMISIFDYGAQETLQRPVTGYHQT